jgi:serine/threonine protein kinase
MRTRKRGGRILGEGYYSIVIYPAIPCKDGRNMTRKASRVLKRGKQKKANLLYDHPVVPILKKIDPKQKYFIYSESCQPGELLPENIEDGITEEDKEYSEVLEKAGETWKNVIPTEKQKKYLLSAIKKLHNAGVVHADIHRNNIVIADDGMPRIVDFGHAIVDALQEIIDLENEYVKSVFPKFKIYKNGSRTEKLRADIEEILKEQQK